MLSSASASVFDSDVAYSKVYIMAIDLKASKSPARIMLPASQLRGDSAFGFRSKLTIALETLSIVH